MRRTRATFKPACRYCKQHVHEIRADAGANSIQSRDAKTFWRNVSKVYNSKATNNVNSIGNAVGDSEVVEMWKINFQRLAYAALYRWHVRQTCLL